MWNIYKRSSRPRLSIASLNSSIHNVFLSSSYQEEIFLDLSWVVDNLAYAESAQITLNSSSSSSLNPGYYCITCTHPLSNVFIQSSVQCRESHTFPQIAHFNRRYTCFQIGFDNPAFRCYMKATGAFQ